VRTTLAGLHSLDVANQSMHASPRVAVGQWLLSHSDRVIVDVLALNRTRTQASAGTRTRTRTRIRATVRYATRCRDDR
jgi:hypothetical protein